MTHFLAHFVTKKRESLRMALLLTLTACVVGLAVERPVPAEAPSPSAGELSGFVVALDPGHGGYDGGARAVESGLWEKDITLQMAQSIESVLSAHGAQVMLTRREDICLAEGDTATRSRKRQDLQRRVDLAEAAGADVFLSIHMNEYRSRREQGPQVFYQKGAEAGKTLAETLQAAILAQLKPERQRQALAGDYYVLKGKLPSALVECGFISNPQEEKRLLDPDYQLQFGEALAQGLIRYRSLPAKP